MITPGDILKLKENYDYNESGVMCMFLAEYQSTSGDTLIYGATGLQVISDITYKEAVDHTKFIYLNKAAIVGSSCTMYKCIVVPKTGNSYVAFVILDRFENS